MSKHYACLNRHKSDSYMKRVYVAESDERLTLRIDSCRWVAAKHCVRQLAAIFILFKFMENGSHPTGPPRSCCMTVNMGSLNVWPLYGYSPHLDDGLQVGQLGDVVPLDGPWRRLHCGCQQAVLRQLSSQPGLHLGVLAQRVHRPGRCVACGCACRGTDNAAIFD